MYVRCGCMCTTTCVYMCVELGGPHPGQCLDAALPTLFYYYFFFKVEAKSPSSWALTSQAGLIVQRTPRVSLICLPSTEILRLTHYLAFSLLFLLIWDKHRSLCCKSNVPSLSYRHPNRMLEGRCFSRYNHSLACHCRGHS